MLSKGDKCHSSFIASRNTGQIIKFVDLENSVDIGGCSEVYFSLNRSLDSLVGGLGHYLFDTSQHNILFHCSFKHQ